MADDKCPVCGKWKVDGRCRCAEVNDSVVKYLLTVRPAWDISDSVPNDMTLKGVETYMERVRRRAFEEVY